METLKIEDYIPQVESVYSVGPVKDPKMFSRALINRMMLEAESKGYRLRHLWVSEEDMVDIRSYSDPDADPHPHIDYWWSARGGIWDITFQIDKRLNGTGKVVGRTEGEVAGDPVIAIVGETGRNRGAV